MRALNLDQLHRKINYDHIYLTRVDPKSATPPTRTRRKFIELVSVAIDTEHRLDPSFGPHPSDEQMDKLKKIFGGEPMWMRDVHLKTESSMYGFDDSVDSDRGSCPCCGKLYRL